MKQTVISHGDPTDFEIDPSPSRSIRIYKSVGPRLICEVYPVLFSGNFDLSPDDSPVIRLSVNPSSPSHRFSVSANVTVTDSTLIDEIERFCQTLKQMYDL